METKHIIGLALRREKQLAHFTKNCII